VLLGQFKASFAHGLLVIAAPESTDSHDGWDTATKPFHAGPDSIYCSVQPEASGLVDVSCHEGNDDSNIQLPTVYTGTLHLPTATLALYDPNQTIRLELAAPSTDIAITIQADDDSEPQQVIITLR
jgi:hypothetical protein